MNPQVSQVNSGENNTSQNGPQARQNTNKLQYGMIACVLLAVAGIGFGVYGMTRKPAEKSNQSSVSIETDSELTEIKNKCSILQNYVKELEAQGIEASEEAKTATEGTSGSILKTYGFLSENIRNEQYKPIPIQLISASYGHTEYTLSSDGVVTAYHNWAQYNEGDRPANQREKDDLTSQFNSRVIDMAEGHVGNGVTSTIFFLQENGRVAWIHDFDLAKDSNQSIAYVEDAQDVVRIYGNYYNQDIAGFAQTEAGEIYALKPINSNGYTVGFTLD